MVSMKTCLPIIVRLERFIMCIVDLSFGSVLQVIVNFIIVWPKHLVRWWKRMVLTEVYFCEIK